MKKLLGLLLALLATVGCDDSTVASLITSNFVCVYMPYWMGECDSPAIEAKTQSLLHNGIVEARTECTADVSGDPGYGLYSGEFPAPFKLLYGVSLLADGSRLVSFNTPGTSFTTLYSRSEVRTDGSFRVSNNPLGEYPTTSLGLPVGTAETDYTRVSVVDGHLTVSFCDAWVSEFPEDYGPGWTPYCPYMSGCADPGCVPALVTNDQCSGFNLEAFGL